MKANIKLMLSVLTPLALLGLLRNVIAKMTSNLLFPAPPVSMPDLELLGDKLEAAIEEATNGSKSSKFQRDVVVAEVEVALQRTADYVRSVCVGDAAKLSTSGFEMAKTRERVGIPAAPKNLVARVTTLPQELELRWPRVYGAYNYRVQISEQDPALGGSWTTLDITSRSRFLVTELESYKAYWFCVSAIGSAGEGAKSDPALGRAA